MWIPRISSPALLRGPLLLVPAHWVWVCLAPLGAPAVLAGDAYYKTSFDVPTGTEFAEWSSSSIVWTNEFSAEKSGVLSSPRVQVTSSPNGHHFLGEFGGPAIGKPGDLGWNATRVEQTITLSLGNLPPHKKVILSFDLLILKSWDGDSPKFGPDVWTLRQHDGPTILSSTFSNNPKVVTEGSYQDYPKPHSSPTEGAYSRNSLGYKFFGDSTYRFQFEINHTAKELLLDFGSSLFEGKGTDDESWGLDNVCVALEK